MHLLAIIYIMGFLKSASRRVLIIAFGLALATPSARADTASKEFVMSCTYGVLAGTLVGAAMLAFTDQPGENLSKVARGASIGLYTGILLGLYVVYGVDENEEEPDMLNGPSEGWRQPKRFPAWAFAPTFGSRGIDGAGIYGQVLSF